jgi:hypothetical protein
LCAKIQQIHKDQSALIFLYFDDSYKQAHLAKNEQLREIDFDDHCYDEILKAFEEKQITPWIMTFRFVPEQGALYLPQSLNLTNECKEEVEVQSIPLLIYDEMLPMA